MDDVLEAAGRREVHSVDIDFGEEQGRCGDDWGSGNLPELADLTQMTRPNVPDHVGLEVRPPETLREKSVRRNSVPRDEERRKQWMSI